MECGAHKQTQRKGNSSDDGVNMQPSPVTSNPPALPTDVRDAGDAEVAAYGETIANSTWIEGLGRESKPYAEKCISF